MDNTSTALNNRILEIRAGSHLFGTNTLESDTDYVGIFMPSEDMIFGMNRCDECKLDIPAKDEAGRNTREAIDRTLHEYKRFCRLALQNNPNIIHILFANKQNIILNTPYGQRLLDNAEMFIHQGCFKRFVAYARAQRHKMIIRRDHFNELSLAYKILCEDYNDKDLMVEVYNTNTKEYTPEGQANGEMLFYRKGTGVHIHVGDICFEPGIYVRKARKMLKERLDKATNRTELVLKHGYDTKFASNLIQLLREGIEILKTGRIQFPLAYAWEILDIKSGLMNANELISYSDYLEAECEKALEQTSLPATPRTKEVENFVKEEVKRYIMEGA